MGYSTGGGSSSIQAATDVALNDLVDSQVLTYNATVAKWENATPVGGATTIDGLPAGSTLTVASTGGTWPPRPTDRTDIIVQWKGPDPSPSIVESGTGGMLDNVDIRFVTP